MVEINKIFRDSNQFNVVAKQFLMNNINMFIKVNDIEFRLFLPFLSDLAPGKPACINANVQRYTNCLVRLSMHRGSASIIILNQFDQELYREFGGADSWIRELYKSVDNITYGNAIVSG